MVLNRLEPLGELIQYFGGNTCYHHMFICMLIFLHYSGKQIRNKRSTRSSFFDILSSLIASLNDRGFVNQNSVSSCKKLAGTTFVNETPTIFYFFCNFP